jgi:DNA primase
MAYDRLKGKKTLKVGDFLNEFEKDDIKRKVDIVELFLEFGVKLKKVGKKWQGICPWHEDKGPSLSVDREMGLYHCFGACGESGDVFTLVEKMKGFDFKDALEFLKKRALMVKPGALTSPDTSAAPEAEKQEPESSNPVERLTLTDITAHYHKKLYENKAALNYLEARGLKDATLYTRFKLGFADGSLLNVCSNGQKAALKDLGIIREKGSEHFFNCITFPILDDRERTVSFYGRRIEGVEGHGIEGSGHLYLAGPHRGVFNVKAGKVYDEIILTESIIDALSLIQLGMENVQACYGTNGFTGEHLKLLKDNLVKTIIIGFDADEAGRKAAASLQEKLIDEGFKVKVISPPIGKDWNDYLLTGLSADKAGGTKAALLEIISQAQAAEKEKQAFTVEKQGAVYVFGMAEISYRVAGVKELFVQDLKVNIKAILGKESFYDRLDLYSARSRASYGTNLGSLFRVEPARIERDLVCILEYLESERDKALTGQEETKEELTEEERSLGEEFLRSADIYEEIEADMETLGYVGEEVNKKLTYLVAVSRLLPKPLSVYIQAGASSGKSYLLETLRKLLPQDCVKALTSFSDQSLNYLKEEDFQDKVFMVGEAIHNEIVEAQVRQMQSENELSRLVTLKDPKTGELESREIRHRVRIAFMMSSTAFYLNPENASRCLVLHVDESAEQTERVLKKQRHKRTFKGHLEEMHTIPEIIKKHRAAQRLLQKIPVFNPFALHLTFPKIRTTMRRAQEQFLILIDCSCLLRQLQKELMEKTDPDTGKTVAGIECDIKDYRISYELFTKGVLGSYYSDLPEGAKMVYETIRALVRELANAQKLSTTEITFIQKQVRERMMLGGDSVRKYINLLVSYEYLQVIGGKRHGTRYCYRLREDKSLEELDISVIPTPEEMEKRIKEKQKTKED